MTSSNDVEGLGYDKEKQLLLLACKGSPNVKQKTSLKKTKTIYAYDLKNKQLVELPYLTISDDQIETFFKEQFKSNELSKNRKKKLRRALEFSPSAIAKNPVDNFMYILSTVGKTMIVVNYKNEIQQIYFLDNDDYIQPEGICFDSSGTMYISNEGKRTSANILKIDRD